MPIQINIICPMATPRTTAGPETSKKAFMRESKTLEKKIKKEKEQVENEVWNLSNHVFYKEEESETILDQKGKPTQK